MRRIIIFILLIFLSPRSFSQEVHSIRFIWVGQESKPIGTVVISVEKLIKPRDKKFDFRFGISIQTDINTFNAIDSLFRTSFYTNYLLQKNEFPSFMIVDSNGYQSFLTDKYIMQFFDNYQDLILREKLDARVLYPFENYYSPPTLETPTITSPPANQ